MLKKLSTREQVLIFIVIATLLAGTYGLFRFVPELKKLTEYKAIVEKNVEKVKNPKFPEEPNEDPDELKEIQAELEVELAGLRSNLESLEGDLAPTDNQEMLLKISEAARDAGVRVIESVPLVVQKKNGQATQPNVQKGSKRNQRRQAREERKKARKAGTQNTNQVTFNVPKEGELIYRLVNELETPRPIQRISVEGSFTDLQKFIQTLRTMTWQATIVKLDIDVSIQTPPQGVPQPILAKMIVAI